MRGRPPKQITTDEGRIDRLLQLQTEQAELWLLTQWAQAAGVMGDVQQKAWERALARIPAPPVPQEPPTIGDMAQATAQQAQFNVAAMSPRDRALAAARQRAGK